MGAFWERFHFQSLVPPDLGNKTNMIQILSEGRGPLYYYSIRPMPVECTQNYEKLLCIKWVPFCKFSTIYRRGPVLHDTNCFLKAHVHQEGLYLMSSKFSLISTWRIPLSQKWVKGPLFKC